MGFNFVTWNIYWFDIFLFVWKNIELTEAKLILNSYIFYHFIFIIFYIYLFGLALSFTDWQMQAPRIGRAQSCSHCIRMSWLSEWVQEAGDKSYYRLCVNHVKIFLGSENISSPLMPETLSSATHLHHNYNDLIIEMFERNSEKKVWQLLMSLINFETVWDDVWEQRGEVASHHHKRIKSSCFEKFYAKFC